MNLINLIITWFRTNNRKIKLNTPLQPTIIEASTSELLSEEKSQYEKEPVSALNEGILELEVPVNSQNEYKTPQFYPIVLMSANDTHSQIEVIPSRNDKGVMEDFFLDYLLRSFGNLVSNNTKITGLTYVPDFIIHDPKNSISLVVEIDEPYTLINGNLSGIHLKGSDDERNIAFMKNGWSIIRFAEEQIVKHPLDCLKLIEAYIHKTIFPTIKEINTWDYKNAEKMIQVQFRNSYLPYPLINSERGDGLVTCRNFNVKGINYIKEKKCFILYLDDPKRECSECWIKRNKFITACKESNLATYFKKIQITISNDELLDLSSKINITAIGTINKPYFNVSDDKISVAYDSDVMNMVKRTFEGRQNQTTLM